MILIDTGPIVALLDKDDIHHATCVTASNHLPSDSLVTTWPCFTEAMYLLGELGGYHYQAELWKLWQAGRLALYEPKPTEIDYMIRLMEKYQDAPMDLADASLVVAAESDKLRRVFTLDSHFRAYRLNDGSALEIAP